MKKKVKYFIDTYNNLIDNNDTSFPNSIKWSETLKRNFESKRKIKFDSKKIINSFYKPFNNKSFYSEKLICDRLTLNHSDFFGTKYDLENVCFGIIGIDTSIPFSTLAFNCINDLNSLSNAAGGK